MNTALCDTFFAEWHGPEPNVRPHKWQALGNVLPKVMQRLGLSERLHETEVIEVWEEIVTSHSSSVRLHEGMLFIWVLQLALCYQFEEISKPAILRKLKRRFGGKIIRDLQFRLGQVGVAT